jgi:methionyl aminopeptidase
MRRAGRIVAQVLDAMADAVKPGVRTSELDALATKIIEDEGATPSFKGYHGYPAAICTSINDQIVHGIPGDVVLQEGDILSVDVGTIYKGYQGDAARTFAVGQISEEARDLLVATKGALEAGIKQARSGNRLGDISHAIQAHAEAQGYEVVREYTGHGIGREMHEDPQIPNFGVAGRGITLKAGMTFALEPMLVWGKARTRVLEDRWTVVTADGVLSAHFEHTIAVTQDGPEVLTKR